MNRKPVQRSSGMSRDELRKHMELRHPELRFWSRGEHDASHSAGLRDFDHIHAEEVARRRDSE